MLNPDYFDAAPIEISRLILDAERSLVNNIARRLRKVNEISGATDYEIMRMMMIREFRRDFGNIIQTMTGKALSEIDNIYEQAVTVSHNSDKPLFDYKNIKFVEYKDNHFLQRITGLMAAQTKNTFTDLSRSIGFTTRRGEFLEPRQYFVNRMDSMIFQVAAGTTTYTEAMRRTIKEMNASGLRSVSYPSAAPRSIEAVTRTIVLAGISQLSDQATWENMRTLGATLIQTTAHNNSRPSHVPWQGRVFALNDTIDNIITRSREE